MASLSLRKSVRVACAARSGGSTTTSARSAGLLRRTPSWAAKRLHQQRRLPRVKALEEDASDDDFEDRLAKLRAAKGTKGRGQGGAKAKTGEGAKKAKKVYDYSEEEVFFEGRPSVGDLAVNVALGATLLWLPLSIASIGRFAWVNYKITDKRISVTNTSPVGNEDEKQLECPMEDIQDVTAIGRGLGIWGDMVINLKDGSKIEIRSIDK